MDIAINMSLRTSFKQLLLLLLCTSFVKSATLFNNEKLKTQHYLSYHSSSFVLPSIEVYEVNREGVDSVKNDIFVGKEDSTVLQMVNTSRNADLLFGEVTRADSALLLHCSAPYSVQWIFRGDSDPEFNTNTTTRTDSSGTNVYSAYLFLGSRRNLNERETGRYICTSVRNRRLYSYLYIFVTKSTLFTNKGLETIYFSEKDDSIRIPCSLSEPRAIATLQKYQNGVLKCPMNDSVRFDAKNGFILNPKKLQQPQGTYLCIADFNNTFQLIKYNVIRDDGVNNGSSDEFDQSSTEPNDFESTPSPIPPTQQSTPPAIFDPPSGSNANCADKTCGKNALCRRNKQGDRVCRCQDGFIGNPYVECKDKHSMSPPPSQADGTTHSPPVSSSTSSSGNSNGYLCASYDECPNDQACLENVCQDPCRVNSICGPNTHCETSYHTPFCKCVDGYEGDPYSSQQGQQCERSSYCDPNPCGPNTVCKYVNGIISCSCQPGFATHNDGACHPNQKKGPKPDPLAEKNVKPRPLIRNRTSTLPPGKECHYDTDCADDKMCIQDKCEDPCVNACGSGAVCHTRNHFPRCLCAEGNTGDPFYKCVPLFSGVLGISATSVLPPKSSNSNGGAELHCGGESSQCGPNTICQASRDQFVCVCPNYFTGDPYSAQGCVRKTGYLKCEQDSDCPHFLACLRQQGCVNPCNVKNVCLEGRSCVPFLHRPACLTTINYQMQYPRDDLTSEKGTTDEEKKVESEFEKIPVGLNSSKCLLKADDGQIISQCGKNSICYDESSLIANGLGSEGIFCGCKENYTGDPYFACESEKVSTNETSKLNNVTTSSSLCSPSPCTNSQVCIIVRASNTAKCVSSSEKLITPQSHPLPTHLLRSDPCLITGMCGENEEEETNNDEETQGTTELSGDFTFTLPPTASSTSYLSSAGYESAEETKSGSQMHLVDNFNFNYSNETFPILSLSNDEETVVDV